MGSWNTNDHGVNNAEGALRYPAAAYRLQNNQSFHAEMDYVLGMLDRWQGQVRACRQACRQAGRQAGRPGETSGWVGAPALLPRCPVGTIPTAEHSTPLECARDTIIVRFDVPRAQSIDSAPCVPKSDVCHAEWP